MYKMYTQWQITMHKYIFFSNKHECHKQNVPPESFIIVLSNSKFFYHQLPFSFYLFSSSNVNSRWMFHKYESSHLFPISHFPHEHFKIQIIFSLSLFPDEYFRFWRFAFIFSITLVPPRWIFQNAKQSTSIYNLERI